ncbi:MAG: diguanylate cyclase [Gammaproteobacteria bacterium]|nr:diguanylate cyclase [Gammaproteobacteria bacterium]
MHQASEHNGPIVYSAEQPPTSTQRRGLSVKLMAYVGVAVIVALFLAIIAANLLLARNHFQPSEAVAQHLSDKAESIHGQLLLLRQIVGNVAVQPTTQDILEYNDTSGAQAWALQMRRFLPQAIGVALLAENGQVLGEPAGHQLGPQCFSDLVRISQGGGVPVPPVHRQDPRNEHYDLTAPVLDEAENPIGTLIVSFRLDTLRELVKNSANANQNLTLRDGHGEIIARQINLDGEHNTHSSTLAIDGTNWQLSLTEKAPASLPSFFSLVTFNISALLLAVGVVIFLLRFAMRRLSTDFENVKGLLNRLTEDTLPDNGLPTPLLRETAEILPTIGLIHRKLDKKRQLLERHQLTDSLTGLPNQRQFDIDFTRAYDFARRGADVCTAALHLSGLDPLTPEQREQAIKVLGRTLRDNARKVDYVAQLEDGQFVLLMFGMKADSATSRLERLHALFLHQQKQHPAIEDEHICGFCCGYTLIHGHRDNNAAEVLERARGALAEAEASACQQIIKG